jgi:hypothetical protein
VSSDEAWTDLARWVKASRDALGLAQDDLSARGGPGETTVHKIENGAVRSLRDRTKRQLERALGWHHELVEKILDPEIDVTEVMQEIVADAARRTEVHERSVLRVIEKAGGAATRAVGTAGPTLTGRALIATRAAGLIADLAQLDDRTDTETTALRALAALVHELTDDQPPTSSATRPMH